MRRLLRTFLGVVLAVMMVTGSMNAQTDKALPSNPSGEKSLSTLRVEIDNVLTEREEALRELNARYATAPLDQRVSLEAEAAQIQTDYERRYLELVIDYHRLSGNAGELARAERMLESLNAGAVTGTPLPLPRDLRVTQTPPASGQTPEGVVRDER